MRPASALRLRARWCSWSIISVFGTGDSGSNPERATSFLGRRPHTRSRVLEGVKDSPARRAVRPANATTRSAPFFAHRVVDAHRRLVTADLCARGGCRAGLLRAARRITAVRIHSGVATCDLASQRRVVESRRCSGLGLCADSRPGSAARLAGAGWPASGAGSCGFR